MKRIQQGLATTLCIMTITFLITMPFILETAADNWSDCDGNGYKHGFNACVEARQSAYDICSDWYHYQSNWWKCIVVDCASFAARCNAANTVADNMCACDS